MSRSNAPEFEATRRICVATFNRADYAPLRALLAELADRPGVDTRVVVSGAHLAPQFGRTIDLVAADGWNIDARVEMLLASDTSVGMGKSFALGVSGLADAIDRIAPDVLLVLGDRYEALAAAVAALLLRVPLAHVAGGQVTSGVIDDSVRHAISKLAHLHFTSAEAFRRRLVQLGEDPERIWTVGSLGLDNILKTPRMDRDELERELGVRLHQPLLLVTYHPAPPAGASAEEGIEALLKALDSFPDATVLFTHPNPDAGGRAVAAAIDSWVTARGDRARAVQSLGAVRYPSVLAHTDVVVGNSSSGLIEASALGVPSVNIGIRQEGRPRAASVIDVPEDTQAMATAISKALSPEFRDALPAGRSPFGDGNAAARISNVLTTVDLSGIFLKHFSDLPDAAIDAALLDQPARASQP